MLSKPIRRPALLVYKYLGGLTFVFLLTAVTVLGVWAAHRAAVGHLGDRAF